MGGYCGGTTVELLFCFPSYGRTGYATWRRKVEPEQNKRPPTFTKETVRCSLMIKKGKKKRERERKKHKNHKIQRKEERTRERRRERKRGKESERKKEKERERNKKKRKTEREDVEE